MTSIVALHTKRNHDSGRPIAGLALCAGFAGLELGIDIAEPGHRTVCFVERETYPAATLVARMEDKALDNAPVWSDLKTFDGRPWRGKVDLITAGYPCQPFTFSGKRQGAADPRHLWPDVARIIREVEPEWVFCENVEGHLTLGFPEVAGELQEMGFRIKAGLFSAYEVGAGHQRRRLFFLAHANNCHERQQGGNCNRGKRPLSSGVHNEIRITDWLVRGRTLLDAVLLAGKGPRPSGGRAACDIPLFAPPPSCLEDWYQVLTRRPDLQPELYGLANGLADRMERSKAAGNGVVPLEAALAYHTLKAAFNDD